MDIKDPKILKLKGTLFLLLGCVAGGYILILHPGWMVLVLLVICVWAFCRFYYFAFYVLEHYADPEFRYAGLLDLAKYLLGKKTQKQREQHREEQS
jgi:hypothetical protein